MSDNDLGNNEVARVIDQELAPGAQAKLGLLFIPFHTSQFVCEFTNADRSRMQAMALEQLPRIGGWYSIQFYRELLSPRALITCRKARTKPENRDMTTTEPVRWGLTGLPKVALNPPTIPPPDSSFDSAKVQQHAQIWRDWIQANEASLKTLQPTREGYELLWQAMLGSV